jgi:hypothetical protein
VSLEAPIVGGVSARGGEGAGVAGEGSTELIAGVEALPTVGLAQLAPLGQLQRRFDDKFLVAYRDLPRLVGALGDGWGMLAVDGEHVLGYRSVYFDTPDLLTYRDHVKGRRRRFKIRTRTYESTGVVMLEVKLKGAAGRTDKRRFPHPGPTPDALDDRALELIGRTVDEAYGHPLPKGLAPVAVTRFRRVTLVHLGRLERITIDLGLTAEVDGRSIGFGAGRAIVETKMPVRSAGAFKQVLRLDHRPQQVSKYCVGVVAAHDHIPGNPWIPALRQLEPTIVG